MTKVAELRELPSEQLEERVRDLDDQVFRLRLQKSMGQTEAANKMKDIRRDRARAKTLLREREIEAIRVEANG
ncbi:MAG TPA: 50S ribosomal protein L29 [Acidobacteria bacterium]|nr:50S ribosomal protein L29 [Acidobacteriota bacterium]HIM14312.1 50S ribosomal protein L29 [Acidobacteriota bacterium]